MSVLVLAAAGSAALPAWTALVLLAVGAPRRPSPSGAASLRRPGRLSHLLDVFAALGRSPRGAATMLGWLAGSVAAGSWPSLPSAAAVGLAAAGRSSRPALAVATLVSLSPARDRRDERRGRPRVHQRGVDLTRALRPAHAQRDRNGGRPRDGDRNRADPRLSHADGASANAGVWPRPAAAWSQRHGLRRLHRSSATSRYQRGENLLVDSGAWTRRLSRRSSSRRSSSGWPRRPRRRAARSSHTHSSLGRRRRGRAPPGADRRGGRAHRRLGRAAARRYPRRSLAGRHAARGGVLAPTTLRRISSTISGGLRAAPRSTRRRNARRSCTRSPRRSSATSRRSRRRSTAASRTTAPTSATTRPPAPAPAQGAARPAAHRRRGAAAARARDGLRDHLQEDFVTAARRPAGARAEGERAAQRPGHRPRLVRLRADALRRAVRDRRAEQPPVGGGGRRARGGGADPRRALRVGRAQAQALTALVEATGALDLASRAERCRAAGAARPSRRPTKFGCSARGTRCSTLRRRCRSTSTSTTCARSSSAARTPAARPSR